MFNAANEEAVAAFLDGAIATLAPDLDLFAEIADISMYFATTHGERIASEVGMDPASWQLDTTGMIASLGVDPETTPRLYNSLLGTKFKIVTGYNSTSQVALAIERGEVQGIGDWSGQV